MKTYLFLSFLLTALFSYGQWSTTNLSEPKTTFGAATLGSKAYFAGGANANGDYLSKVEIYDVKTKKWSYSNLSTRRQFPSGVSCGSKVFFAGGAFDNKSFDIVDIYDTITQAWTVEHLSDPRLLVSAIAKGNKVLFAGGVRAENNTFSNVVDIYDVQTGLWSKDTLSMARASMGVAIVGDLAIYAGGFNIKSFTNRVDIYNFTTGKWTTDTLSLARGLTGATTVGNKVLIAGGMTDPQLSSSTTDLVDIYDGLTGKWSTAKLSLPRCFTERTAVTMGDKAYFIGGGNFSGIILDYFATYNVIDIYDNKTGTWSVDHLPHDVINHGVTVVGNTLLVAGGWSSTENKVFSTVEIFTEPASSSPILPDNQYFQVYPNPAKDMLTIVAPNGISIDDVTIYNMAGQKVLISKGKNQRINISRLQKGMYFIVMTSGQQQLKKKLIVE